MHNILLVDDQLDIHKLVEQALSSQLGEDFSLTIATNREQARAEILSDKVFDVVLLDLCLPDFTGFDLMQWMLDTRPSLAIVVVSGSGTEQTVVEALERGAMSYVGKTALTQSLARTVLKVINANQQSRRIRQVRDGLSSICLSFEIDNDPALIQPLLHEVRDALDRFKVGGSCAPQLIVGVEEAIANALYHGNLEIGSELKHTNFSEFYKQAQQARLNPKFSRRSVRLSIDANHDGAKITVADDGQGFDPTSVPDPTLPENIARAHGRGLLMMRAFFDSVRFNKLGNVVTLTVRNDQDATGECAGSVEDAA
ncbi:MAG: ATP-binding protein [Phycisphaeraceae bacterium]